MNKFTELKDKFYGQVWFQSWNTVSVNVDVFIQDNLEIPIEESFEEFFNLIRAKVCNALASP